MIWQVFLPEADNDEVVIRGGSEVGCMLVDGRGDGVCLEHPKQDMEFMRLTSFGMLQVFHDSYVLDMPTCCCLR